MPETETLTGEALRALYDEPAPMTVGVEEELMLLDPATLDLAPVATRAMRRLGDDPRFKLEFPASQLEIVTRPAAHAGEAVAQLTEARRHLADALSGLVRLAAAGLHPFAAVEGELNRGARYDRTVQLYGPAARRQLLCALQVHVAVRGADRAVAVHDALRSYLPELAALAANSPFHGGRDTGMAWARSKVSELLPRQGVPPVLWSWDALAEELRWGVATEALADQRSWWWEIRPNPVYGTLEVRVPDAQATVRDAGAIVATVHALVAWLAERHDAGDLPAPAPTWRIEENRWSAAYRGTRGELADLETGARVPTERRLHHLLDTLQPIAARQGAGAELAAARELVAGNGAERQRAAGDPHAAAAWLADSFLEGLGGDG